MQIGAAIKAVEPVCHTAVTRSEQRRKSKHETERGTD